MRNFTKEIIPSEKNSLIKIYFNKNYLDDFMKKLYKFIEKKKDKIIYE